MQAILHSFARLTFQFSEELVGLIESISISNCDSLSLDLSARSETIVGLNNASSSTLGLGAFSGPVDLEVSNANNVELVLDRSDGFLRHLFLDNVSYVETLLVVAQEVDEEVSSDRSQNETGDGEDDDDDWPFGVTREDFYLYIIIVLGALLLITWAAIPMVVLCVRRGR